KCGTFTDTVTIQMGCIISDKVYTSPSYCIAAGGTAKVHLSNGVSPYTYTWSSGQTTSTASGLTAGSYSVTVLDSYGCSVSDTFTVHAGSFNITSSATPTNINLGDSTFLQATVFDSISSSSYSSSYTIAWSPSGSVTNPDSLTTYAHPAATTTYTVTATTLCGTFTDTVTIDVNPLTGIGAITAIDNSLTASPNPGNGLLTISYNLLKDENIR